MTTCRSAGIPCVRTAVLVARIANVGDRALCQSCHDTYISMGMDLRVLPTDAPVPAWRQRSLAKDLTGRAA